MPRIRTVKPEFWGDEKLGPLEPIDRLVFLGLISLADDAGRLMDNVKVVDAFVFPYTDDTSAPSLEKLAQLGRIERGHTNSGQAIIQLVNWSHQKIDKPNLRGALPPIRRSIAEGSASGLGGVGASINDQLSVPTTNDQRPTSGTDMNDLATQMAATANQALKNNPRCTIGELQLRPLQASRATQCAEDWTREGIPPEVILKGIATVCAAFRPSKENPRIGSFRYFEAGVHKAWEESKQGDSMDKAFEALA